MTFDDCHVFKCQSIRYTLCAESGRRALSFHQVIEADGRDPDAKQRTSLAPPITNRVSDRMISAFNGGTAQQKETKEHQNFTISLYLNVVYL